MKVSDLIIKLNKLNQDWDIKVNSDYGRLEPEIHEDYLLDQAYLIDC